MPTRTRRTSPARRAALRTPYGVISIVAGLLLWELLVRVFEPNPLVIVAPSTIAATLWELFRTGSIWPDLIVSMQGFAIGYVLAAVVAIALGLAIGASTILYRWTNPWVNALYATPIIGLAPLMIIIFGFGLQSKVAVVIALVIFPILINTVAGARAVSTDYRELAVVYQASRFETFTKVLFPGALPFILTGLRLAVGRGLIGVVVADLFGASSGLGLNLQQSAQSFDTPNIFAVTVLLAFLGIVLTGVIEFFEHRAHRGMK
ncbi:ABC transporter permease [Actinomycetospora termitidis]|uniref:ABC transporter permease n=1 Tax=Actinomycetospora termitidis TaxID=3053470 RepID=A0ABT7MHL2_9PSEU|nr:ABC transporter permease [Actinomycetospora sp. Odt1-22]MDL5159674.1 ABC transporter permease [Actinomycetospora sp. Odt1-22]